MPHATIFAINYAPEPSGNAVYTTALAEHLVTHGWKVDVHTGVPHYPQWRRQGAAGNEIVNGVTVTRHQHFVPSSSSTYGRAAMEATWSATSVGSFVRGSATDIVIGVVPALSGATTAVTAARRWHVPCVLWFQDLMGPSAEQSGVSGGSHVAGAVAAVETRAARRADTVMVVAEGFQGYFEDAGLDASRIEVVRNWNLLPPPSPDRQEARARFGFAQDELVAIHSGNMGVKQGLDIVVEAAELAPDVTFVLQGNGGERQGLVDAAERAGIENVRFLSSLPGDDLADLLGAADVLLLTQRDTVTDMSLPSKLTSYLSSGTPIVASIHAASEAAALLSDAGVGEVVAPMDASALVAGIRNAASAHRRTIDAAALFGSPGVIEEHLLAVLGESAS